MQEARLRIAALDKLYSLRYTEAIWTKPYGSVVGEASKLCSNLSLQSSEASPTMYLNQLVCAETTLEVEELIQTLKDIEQQMGRTQEDRRQGIVRIDLDLLLYNKQRYHQRDWDRPYVKDLLPSLELPSLVGEGLGVGSVSFSETGYYRPHPCPSP